MTDDADPFAGLPPPKPRGVPGASPSEPFRDVKTAPPAEAPISGDELTWPSASVSGSLLSPSVKFTAGTLVPKMVSSVPESAKNFGHALVQPFLHPIDTAKSLGNIGYGLGSKAAGLVISQDPVKKAENEAAADAVGRFYADRYGSAAGFKKALASDPVGILADASTVLTGGGALAARAPGLAGVAGEAVASAGRAANPINIALSAAKPVVSGTAKALSYPLAAKTGASPTTLKRAVTAGEEGSAPFIEQLRGRAEPSAIVDAAHDAVKQLAQDRQSAYLNSMSGIRANQTPVGYGGIKQAIQSAYGDVMHGQNVFRPEAKAVLDQIRGAVDNWQATPNSTNFNYHGIEGVDRLKQLVGEIRSSAPPGSPAEMVGTKVYNAIKDSLIAHDPAYAKAMGAYSDASDTLTQLRKTLAVNPRAPVDRTLRQLLLADKQVDGHKASLLKELMAKDPELGNMIAGHLLSPALPTGLRGNIGMALAPNAMLAASGSLDPVGHAILAGANAVTSSPRVAGEALYKMGQFSGAGPVPTKVITPAELAKAVDASNPDASGKPKGSPSAPPPRPWFGPGKRPEERPARASGGAVGFDHGAVADGLIRAAKQAKDTLGQTTQHILKLPDESVAHALGVANASI